MPILRVVYVQLVPRTEEELRSLEEVGMNKVSVR